LNTGKYTEAIDYLSKFKSDDIVLSALAKGAMRMLILKKKSTSRSFRELCKSCWSLIKMILQHHVFY
jgi:hypothetical protein